VNHAMGGGGGGGGGGGISAFLPGVVLELVGESPQSEVAFIRKLR
jgi:hypothetical protein